MPPLRPELGRQESVWHLGGGGGGGGLGELEPFRV